MSFYHYRKFDNRCVRVDPVRLTGNDGVLARHLTGHKEADTPYAWRLGNEELIRLVDPSLDPLSNIIVLDLLPESFFEACLYQVTTIQGCSEIDSSDVVLACQVLYQGEIDQHSETFKRDFEAQPPGAHRQLLEAMRLTGGTSEGNYFWSSPKMDIGAAVCAAI